MRTTARGLSAAMVLLALAFTFAGTALAQATATSSVRNFEVISVDGSTLVFRDQNGTNAITVPDDFRFTVDGKKVAVSELKPGMKGTAVVTTTTTVIPVYVTEVREAVVLSAGPGAMTVKDKEGVRKRYSQEQLDKQGIRIFKDGRALKIGEVKEGDVLTATIVSQVAPVVVTEQEVQAALAKPSAEPAPAKAAAAEPAKMAAAEPAKMAAAAPAAPATAPSPSAAVPASQPAESSGLGMMTWLLIAIAAVIALYFFMRRGKQA